MCAVLVSWFYRSKTRTFKEGYSEESPPLEDFEFWLKMALDFGHQYLSPPVYHYGLEYSNYTIRMNLINLLVPRMMRRSGMEPRELLHRGKSNRISDYMGYYTTETRGLVEDRWSKDLELTNYKFGD